jgi:hypothetical protein
MNKAGPTNQDRTVKIISAIVDALAEVGPVCVSYRRMRLGFLPLQSKSAESRRRQLRGRRDPSCGAPPSLASAARRASQSRRRASKSRRRAFLARRRCTPSIFGPGRPRRTAPRTAPPSPWGSKSTRAHDRREGRGAEGGARTDSDPRRPQAVSASMQQPFEHQLPAWVLQPFHQRTWENFLPPPRFQLSDLLPRHAREVEAFSGGTRLVQNAKTFWGGTCALHAYSEAFTARMRIMFPSLQNHEVHLAGLILCAAGHGVLTERGTSVTEVGQIARFHGIPLEAETNRPPYYRVFALGTNFDQGRAMPLPFPINEDDMALFLAFNDTREQILDSMAYRVYLCSCIDQGPIVVFFHLQPHYHERRLPGVPYRSALDGSGYYIRFWPDTDSYVSLPHAVTVYAYKCPGGDVRTLTLFYQENMKDAPGRDRPGRHAIHPDALEYFYVPRLDNLALNYRPKEGINSLLHPPIPKPQTIWDANRLYRV